MRPLLLLLQKASKFLQAKQMTLSQKNEALELFVREGWLAETPSRKGFYSLGVGYLSPAVSSVNLDMLCQGSSNMSV